MTNNQLTDLRTLILSEVGDFFAGVGSPGEPGTPEEMQRELSMRLGRILNNHIVNYPRCEALVGILRECRIARDEAQAELQERRKAERDSEPVATLDVQSRRPDGSKFALVFSSAAHKLPDDVYFLYRHAQHPVVPDDVLDALQKVARIRLDLNDFDGDRRGIAFCLSDAEETLIEVVNRRAAMLQGAPVCTCPSGDGSLRWPCPVHPGNSQAIPEGYVMVPKEPTEAMMLHNSGCQHHAWDDPDCAMRQTRRLIWSHMLAAAPQETSVNDVTTGKPLTITLPDISSKAFWSGAGKNETFHPETYRRWVKEAVERACIIASIDVEVK